LETENTLNIEIKDNGRGFNLKETLNSGNAFGLHNIIERSRIMGGEAKIKSSEEGTIVSINISTKDLTNTTKKTPILMNY
jgi:two-component system, NarL family, sensor kinase